MLYTKRTKIYPLEERHLLWLKNLRNDPATWYWLTDVTPINDIREEKWFTNMCFDPNRFYLAIDIVETRRFIGIVRADEWDKINRSIRIGIDIDPEYRGQGYGTECLTTFVDYCFRHLNIHRCWLLVAEYNDAGRHLYEKLGFTEEGVQRDALFRDGKYANYVSMSLLEDEFLGKEKKRGK